MNIFILDKDLDKSANLLCDQHLSKQILELCQILSTNGYGPYKPTHKNHPASKWVGNNLIFCFKYLEILAKEWNTRNGKWHKSYIDTCNYEDNIPAYYQDSNEPFPIRNDLELVLEKYREWEKRETPFIPKWTNREIPDDVKELLNV